jgi:hypothetical protein
VIKIKSIAMQTKRILQAVVLIVIVGLAAGCAASKEYTSKLFSPRNEPVIDSQATALRFLELDNLQPEKEGWVTTDIIMGKDTGSNTLALDKLAKIYYPIGVPKDTTTSAKADLSTKLAEKTIPIPVDSKPAAVETKPAAVESKPVQSADQPIAKNYNPAEVRNKKTREK